MGRIPRIKEKQGFEWKNKKFASPSKKTAAPPEPNSIFLGKKDNLALGGAVAICGGKEGERLPIEKKKERK